MDNEKKTIFLEKNFCFLKQTTQKPNIQLLLKYLYFKLALA